MYAHHHSSAVVVFVSMVTFIVLLLLLQAVEAANEPVAVTTWQVRKRCSIGSRCGGGGAVEGRCIRKDVYVGAGGGNAMKALLLGFGDDGIRMADTADTTETDAVQAVPAVTDIVGRWKHSSPLVRRASIVRKCQSKPSAVDTGGGGVTSTTSVDFNVGVCRGACGTAGGCCFGDTSSGHFI